VFILFASDLSFYEPLISFWDLGISLFEGDDKSMVYLFTIFPVSLPIDNITKRYPVTTPL
jgi:hypothetical protein